LASYREAFKTSGAKNDPVDADLLREMVYLHHDKMITKHHKFRSFAAYLFAALLVVASPGVLQGVASGSAQITTISGRPAIVVVGGPGGTRINTYNGNLYLPRMDLQIPGHDRLNSVRQLIDDAGAVRNSYDYDAWGNTRSSVENMTNPATYTGRERDSESGLYFYRARSYDAGMGRFIQQDPVDDNSGRSLSVYVDNNPMNATDPSGAVPFWIPAVIAIVVIVSWPTKLGNDELPPPQLPNPQIQQLQQQNQQLQQQVQQLQQQMQQMNDLKKQNQELIDLLKQRMEMDRLKKNGQRGGANVPGGGNEAASSGIDGGYGSGTVNCISFVTRISTVPIIGEPVRLCDIRLPVPTPF
jgi:RHS repeat-associated protein